MIIFIACVLGAFFNMYRGGLFPKTKLFGGQSDLVNAGAFAVLCYVLSNNLIVLPIAFLVMLRFATPAWGPYVGAIIDQPRKTRPAVEYIDDIIEPITNDKLWGVSGLSIRCGEWGFFLGAMFLSCWPFLAGLLAGPIVYLCTYIIPTKYVWKVWEGVQGALLWGAVVISFQ